MCALMISHSLLNDVFKLYESRLRAFSLHKYIKLTYRISTGMYLHGFDICVRM